MIWVFIMKLATFCQQSRFHHKDSKLRLFWLFLKILTTQAFFFFFSFSSPSSSFSSSSSSFSFLFSLDWDFFTTQNKTQHQAYSLRFLKTRDFVHLNFEVVSFLALRNDLTSKCEEIFCVKNWQGVILWFWGKKKKTLYSKKNRFSFWQIKLQAGSWQFMGRKTCFKLSSRILRWINALSKNHNLSWNAR